MREVKIQDKKKSLFVAVPLMAFLFLVSCIPQSTGDYSVVVRKSSDSSDETEKKTPTRRRRDEIRSNYFGKAGETCDEDDRCRDVCEELYDDDDGAQEDCFLLKEDVVDQLEEIVQTLEDDPTMGQLRRIDYKMFTLLMELSVEPWVKALRRSSKDEAELILTWIARDREISQIVYDYGSKGNYIFKDYAGLRELLTAASTISQDASNCDKFKDGLTKELNDSSFSFCQIADRENNEYGPKIVVDLEELEECTWTFDSNTEPCRPSP